MPTDLNEIFCRAVSGDGNKPTTVPTNLGKGTYLLQLYDRVKLTEIQSILIHV